MCIRLLLSLALILACIHEALAATADQLAPPAAFLTPDENKYLAEKKEITFCVDPDWMPFEAISNGQLNGMTSDFSALFAQRLGVTFRLVPTSSWSQSKDLAKTGICDILPMIPLTENLTKDLIFTDPYLSYSVGIIAANELPFISGLDDLSNHPVGIVRGYSTWEYAEANFPQNKFVPVEGIEDGLLKVSSGKISAFLIAVPVAVHNIKELGLSNLKVAGHVQIKKELRIAVNNKAPELAPIIKKMVKSLSKEDIDGAYRKWVTLRYEPQFDYALFWKIGGALLIVILAVLVWNRKLSRLNKKIVHNESRFRAIAEASPNIIVITRLSDGKISYANPATYTISGHRPEDIVGGVAPDFYVNPDDRDNYIDELRRRGESLGFEAWLKKKDGTPFLVRSNSRVVLLDNEPYIVGELEDITERKLQQRNILKLSHALEQSPSMVFITDVEGNIEYVNQMFLKIFGYTREEVIGKNPRILKSGEIPTDLYQNLWKTITSGNEWRGDLKDRRKDGSTFWAHATISPVKDEAGAIMNFICMHEDITQRKNMEIREHEARQRAEVASRAKSELLANMSHELRTPLNAIIGFSQIFQDEVFGSLGNKKYKEYANDINDSGTHLLSLINDILDMSAIEAGKIHLDEAGLSLQRIVNSSIRLIKPRATKEGITLTEDIPPKFPNIHADERRLKQILLNLLSNAVKFTEPGGEVTLILDIGENGEIVIVVKDTGIGMTKEEIRTAMIEFGQVDSGLDRRHEGTGLGLPLTESLVKLHGGTLSINSEKGVGTTVTVNFPPERTVKTTA